jgi:peptide/nickel transport system substrate-binding protein
MLADEDSIRYDLYRQADRVIIEDAPFVPIWYDEVIHLIQPYISGFSPNALNLLELRHTKIKK